MAHALATNSKSPLHEVASDLLSQPLDHLSNEIQSALTADEGLVKIASAFSAVDVTIERITLIRNHQSHELTVNENASGVRRDIEAQLDDLTIKVTCLTPMAPNLNATLQSLVTMAALAAQNWSFPTSEISPAPENSRMIGTSPQMQKLNLQIRQAARSPHNVLIKGESGTGKTTAALMIHEQSARGDKPFVELNCAAIPEALLESELFGHEKGAFTGAGCTKKGLFEMADGGTLFLDEIADLNIGLQAKLLKAIEQKKVRRVGGTKDIYCNVRIIAASSSNFETMIKERTFRADLFYRLAILEIDVPALRQRTSDIPALIQNRLRYEQELVGQNEPFKIETDALKALSFYEWPGNIRELQNTISKLTASLENDSPITREDVASLLTNDTIEEAEEGSVLLPPEARIIRADETLFSYIARLQLLAIEATAIAEGNNTRAARRLGYRRTSLVGLKQKLLRARDEESHFSLATSDIVLAPEKFPA